MAGTVTAPTSARVMVNPHRGLVTSPDLLKGFTDGNFDGICFEAMNTSQFKQLAAAMLKLQSINRLVLQNIEQDASFEQEFVKVINQYPNLTRLETSVNVDGHAFSQIHRLKMLAELSISGIKKNCDQIFVALSASSQLTKLNIVDCRISASDLRPLGTCPNLKAVSFRLKPGQVIKQFDQISSLTQLKQLSHLDLATLSYSPALIDTLGKFKSLKGLKCELTSDWSMVEKGAVRQALPYTEIWLSWPVVDNAGPGALKPGAGEGGLPPNLSDIGELQVVHYRPLQNPPVHLIK